MLLITQNCKALCNKPKIFLTKENFFFILLMGSNSITQIYTQKKNTMSGLL